MAPANNFLWVSSDFAKKTEILQELKPLMN